MRGYVPPWTLQPSHGIPYDFAAGERTNGRYQLADWPLGVGPDDPEIALPINALVGLIRWHGRRWQRPDLAAVTPAETRDLVHGALGIGQDLWPLSLAVIVEALRGGVGADEGPYPALQCREVPHAVDVYKWALASGYPLAVGLACTDIVDDLHCVTAGELLPPPPGVPLLDGTCVLLVGWDDEKAAFRCRSVGRGIWGEEGYGWVPYPYVTQPKWAHEVLCLIDI